MKGIWINTLVILSLAILCMPVQLQATNYINKDTAQKSEHESSSAKGHIAHQKANKHKKSNQDSHSKDSQSKKKQKKASPQVLDTIPPVISQPADIYVAAQDTYGVPSTNGTISDFLSQATATDNIDGTLVTSHNAPAVLPIGVTNVLFTATDSSGNTSQVTANIEVHPLSFGAKLVSPLAGSVLVDTYTTFNWVNPYSAPVILYVGSAPGLSDYHNSGLLTNATSSVQVNSIPADGQKCYARLYSWNSATGSWIFTDTVLTASTAAGLPAALSSPLNNATLASTTATFSWLSNGARNYWLSIGSTLGGFDVYSTGLMPADSTAVTISGLPGQGSLLYVRLYSWNGVANTWNFNDYTFTSSNVNKVTPILSSHTPGQVLTGKSALFTWNSTGASTYRMQVGSSLGGHQYFDSGNISAGLLSQQVNSLPINGSTVYVRLLAWDVVTNSWAFSDSVLTAHNAAARITTPVTGSTIAGGIATLNWNDAAKAQYRIYIGTQTGTADIFDSGNLAASVLSQAVTGLPTNGTMIYIRLFAWDTINNTWVFTDSSYNTAP